MTINFDILQIHNRSHCYYQRRAYIFSISSFVSRLLSRSVSQIQITHFCRGFHDQRHEFYDMNFQPVIICLCFITLFTGRFSFLVISTHVCKGANYLGRIVHLATGPVVDTGGGLAKDNAAHLVTSNLYSCPTYPRYNEQFY